MRLHLTFHNNNKPNQIILSCFLRKKHDFLLSLQHDLKIMVIASQLKRTLDAVPEGIVLTIKDFNVGTQYEATLVKALNRLVAKGALNKVSKGKYFKPRRSMFGILNPSVSEITKDFLEKNGKVIGYITGPAAFASMGLTSQITTSILVGSNKYRRPVTRGNSTISFFLQLNPINEENIPLLRILDASKLINVIPGTTIDENVDRIGNIISKLSKEEQERLCILAEQYPPRVRSLLGAILENINASTYSLMDTLNGVTTYKLPVSYRVLPTKRNWNII